MAFGLCPEDWVVVYLSWSLKKGQFTLRGYLKMRKKSGGAPWFIKWGVLFLNLFIPVWFFFFFLYWTYFSSLIFWKTLKWKRKKKYILIQRTLKSYLQLLVTLFFSSKISICSLSFSFFAGDFWFNIYFKNVFFYLFEHFYNSCFKVLVGQFQYLSSSLHQCCIFPHELRSLWFSGWVILVCILDVRSEYYIMRF